MSKRNEKLSALKAENARLQKALDAVVLVREAWTPDERLKLESRIAELKERVNELESCIRKVRENLTARAVFDRWRGVLEASK